MAPAVTASTTSAANFWPHRYTTLPSSRTISVLTSTELSTTCTSSTTVTRQTKATTTSGHRRDTSSSDLKTKTAAESSQTTHPTAHHSGNAGPSSSGRANPSHTSSASTNGPNLTQSERSFHLTLPEKKAVIACSVIGGVFILAFVAFLLWRRRRQQKSTAQALFGVGRSPSQTTFLTAKTRDRNLTALPMHRDRREARAIDDSLALDRPVGQDLWKSANPPTPTHFAFARNARKIPNSSLLKPPEMAMLAGAGMTRPSIRVSSHDDTFNAPAESIHAPSTIDLEARSISSTPTSNRSAARKRWSMSTSFVSAKSRLSGAPAMPSFPGIRNVKGWVGGSSLAGGQPGSSGSSLGSMLKNKATKPNLAPVPTRGLSRRQFSASSSDRSFKKGLNVHSTEIDGDGQAIPDDGVVS